MSLTDLPLLLWMDLAGCFVFGLSGATLAVRRELDIFGVAVLSLAAALAGGVMRDLVLGATPPAAFGDARYLGAGLAAAAAGFFGHRWIERAEKPVMLLDAAGLGLFAVAGCRKALLYGLDPLPAVVLGILTATGGGALRDMLVAEVPRVLRGEIYALAALLGAGIVVLGGWAGLPEFWVAVAGVAAAFGLRVLTVRRGWQAPRAPWS